MLSAPSFSNFSARKQKYMTVQCISFILKHAIILGENKDIKEICSGNSVTEGYNDPNTNKQKLKPKQVLYYRRNVIHSYPV